MQVVKFKNSDISQKSKNIFNNAIALLDKYNKIIKKNSKLNEEEINLLINVWNNANNSLVLTEKQKEQLFLRITRLFYLSGYSNDVIKRYDDDTIYVSANSFYNRIMPFLVPIINSVNKGDKLTIDKKEELIRLKEIVERRRDLTLDEKNKIITKIYLIFNLLTSQKNSVDDAAFIDAKKKMIHKYIKKYQEDINELTNYFADSNVKKNEDYYNNIEKVIKMYNEILTMIILNKQTKRLFLKNIYDFIYKYIEIDDILTYWKSIDYKNGVYIENIITKIEMQQKHYNKILEFLFDCKKVNYLTYQKVLRRLSSSERTNTFNDLIKDILDNNINAINLEKILMLLASFDCFKMITVNNYENVKKVIFKFNLLLNNSDEKKENYELLKQVSDKLTLLIEEIDKKGIVNKIVNKDISFDRNEELLISKLDLNTGNYELIENQNIIAIDEEESYDLDTAFSIKKDGDVYLLNVYITDVPSVLLQNKSLAETAYQNGVSYYLTDKSHKDCFIVDMIPPCLSHELLSLNGNGFKKVITFHYIISNSGEVLSGSIEKNLIKINYNLTKKDAIKILQGKIDSRTRKDLECLSEVSKLVSSKANEKYLKELQANDLIAITSVLTNYFVGQNADFAIYRHAGAYTKERKEYTHSVTPLRRFVSDINLGLLLNQLDLLAIDDKDIYLLEDNIDEVIDHLNEVEKIGQYVSCHGKQMIKYLKL